MIDNLAQQLQTLVDLTGQNLKLLAWMLGILWFVYILTLLTGNRLLYLGILPRTLHGLVGILFAPFLHAGFNHLFFNSIALVVLANFVLMHGISVFVHLTVFIILAGGLMLWLIGKRGLHVGASGVIKGYWAYIVYTLPSLPLLDAMIVGFVSIYYFGGIFIGIFPAGKGVSWEGHLCGLIAGLLFAFYF